MKSKTTDISRRKFLTVTGGATIFITGTIFIPKNVLEEGSATLAEKPIDVWVRITSDGKITIYNPAAEMGQGSMTAVPVILAEEMDAEWNDVTIENSPIEPEIYGVGWRKGGTKNMLTVGSRTIRSFYSPMREAGARIRQGLMQNVANKWKVPIGELTTKPSQVIHSKTNRTISYGEISLFADFSNLPDVSPDTLKEPSDFRLIGKVLPRFDIPYKTIGSAKYAMDISLPGMLYGFINRAPVNGATPKLMNEAFIRSIEGVEQVVKLDHGIGILATSIELGLKTKLQLQIEWSDAPATAHNSEADMANYDKADGSEKIVVNVGKVDDEMSKAVTTYQANFTNAYVYHAQMEPLNAVVAVSKDKKSAELWIGSQSPDGAKSAVAQELGIQISDVKVNHLYLGGGFGRRSMADYASECAALAKTTDQPVKLIWTREDDLQYGAFRPQCLQQLKAGVNNKGMITAWSHKSIGPGGGLLGGADISHYDIPNKTFTLKSIEHGIRTKHWRAVGHGAGKFAIEAFIDQIARAQNRDPFAYRVELMSQDNKARKVLEKVGQISNWKSSTENGKGRGIAFADRDSYTAGVAEISVDSNTGVIKVHKFWCVIDAGVIVQPDNATAQIEGAITMGISSALKEQITFKSGKVEQSNFHDYPILRMSESPESIEVAFIESTDAPTGMGEAALPLAGGAIASAFAVLTGKYLYDMPFTPERVLEVLKG